MSEAEKLDGPSRHLLSRLAAGDADLENEVGILVRGRGEFSGRQLEALRADGVEVRTVAGDVLSATVKPASLSELVRHEFVAAVQLSQPLGFDGGEQAAPYYDVE